MKPKISFITVVRNGAPTLARCLASVATQDYENVEYLVLDGASTDGTQAVVEAWRERLGPRLAYFHSRPDKGAYDAALQGYALATGDIMGLLHADDWLDSGAASALAELYRARPEAEIFCFGMQEHVLQGDGTLLPTRVFRDPPGEVFGVLDGLYCQGVNRFYARELLAREAHFRNDRYPDLADREFYIRLGRRQTRKVVSERVLYHFTVHPGSNSTGGTPEKLARFLLETARMADDHLREGMYADARERALLADWYCFNALRAAALTLKAGSPASAFRQLFALWRRYPLRSLKNVAQWRMPVAYRPR